MSFKDYRRTSPRGMRNGKYHAGIDLVKLKGGVNAPIEAFTAGKVLYAGWGHPGTGLGGYGNVVVVEDKNGCAHIYAHLHQVSVKTGQTINKGTVVGLQGNTGDSKGAHLHYEIRKSSKTNYGWRQDRSSSTHEPEDYLKSFNQKSISEMAQEVIDGKHGNGHENRRKSLGISLSEYEKVRAEVNRRVGVSSKPNKSISQMATEVIQGKHGNGHANRQKSLGIDKSTYEKVRAEVNKRLS